ncbi:MAG: hypothetical protein LBQ66_08995 [Planctomycetaceae bacterium]|jgi:hypothetical protein|nr:hypothetical protein [Planctomycetaceae bacterium]
MTNETKNEITKNENSTVTGIFSKIEQLITDNWYPLTLGLFSFPFWCLMVATFGFIVGIPITKYHAIASLVIMLITVAWACQWKLTKCCVHWILLSCVLFCSFIFGSFFTDKYGDSIAYHKPASIDIKTGWIPLWDFDNNFSVEKHKFEVQSPQRVGTSFYWSNYYPKADEIVNAVLYAFSGNIDLGGSTHILYLITIIIIVFNALGTLFKLNYYQRFFLSLVTALNPIMLHVMFTGYVDGVLYDSLTILFFSLAAYLKGKDKRFLPFIIASIVIATNLKFTGIIFVSVFLFFILVPHIFCGLWNKKSLNCTLTVTICFATILSLIVGINPYLHNLYYHFTPLYPLHSVKKDDIRIEFMKHSSECNVDGANKVQQFAFAYLIPTDKIGWYPGVHKWKGRKFGIHNITVNRLFTDRHIQTDGYFGDFFIIPMWFSLLAIFFIRGRDTWFFLIAILASIFVLPYIWYPRYNPHIWLVPIVVISSLLSQLNPTTYRWRMQFISCLMLLCMLVPSYQLIDICFPKRAVRNLAYIAYFIQKEPNYIFFDIEHLPKYHLGEDGQAKYYYVEALIPDWHSNYQCDKQINADVPKKYLGELGKCPVYLLTNQDELNELKDFRLSKFEIITEILKLRLRQLKKVWSN